MDATIDNECGAVRPRRRLFLALSLAAMVPLLAFSAFSVGQVLAGYRAAEEGRLRDVGRALGAAVDAQLASSFLALRILASSTLLDRPLSDPEEFERYARRIDGEIGRWMVLQGPPPEHVTLANALRRPGDSLPPIRPPEVTAATEMPLRLVFEHLQTAVSSLFRGPMAGGLVLAAFVPVIRDERVTHALSFGFQPNVFRKLLLEQRLRDGVFAFLVDGNHRVIAHSLETAEIAVGTSVPTWMIPELQAVSGTMLVGLGLLGSDNIYAVAQLNLAPDWRVIVARPVDAVSAAAWRSARWLPLGGVAVALGVGGVIWASRREALVDARKDAEALSAGRAEVERLLGGLPAVIFLRHVAPDGSSRLLYRGGDIEKVIGWPLPKTAERPDFDHLVHPDEPALKTVMWRLLHEGQTNHEWRLRQPDGGWRRLHTDFRVLARRPDGGFEVVGYTLDVTSQREAEARSIAAARLASVGEMAAGLAHEIKQPLQTISLSAEIAQLAARRGNTIEIAARLEGIVDQTQRTADLIERLRRFARGAEDVRIVEAVPLAQAIDGALELVRFAFRDADIAVEVDLGDPPPTLRGQGVLLEQVLTNLLLNARDALATRPAGAPRRISIAAAPGPDGMVQLTVGDTGGGIAPEVMARLFEPFVTTKGPDKGTGLGLSICHGLIKGMDGSIEAHNDGDGAVFTIRLHAA